MKTIITQEVDWREAYARLTEIIQPRPIALASTFDPDKGMNLAPFSFYNFISCDPLLLAFSPLLSGRTGEKKDTLKNIEKNPEFVIATVTESIAQQVNAASGNFEHGVNEFEQVGLTPIKAEQVNAYLVKESPVNIECTLLEIRNYGTAGGAGNLVVGKIERIHIDEAVLNTAGAVDPALLQAVGRMGGEDWSTTRDRFAFPRPDRRA